MTKITIHPEGFSAERRLQNSISLQSDVSVLSGMNARGEQRLWMKILPSAHLYLWDKPVHPSNYSPVQSKVMFAKQSSLNQGWYLDTAGSQECRQEEPPIVPQTLSQSRWEQRRGRKRECQSWLHFVLTLTSLWIPLAWPPSSNHI